MEDCNYRKMSSSNTLVQMMNSFFPSRTSTLSREDIDFEMLPPNHLVGKQIDVLQFLKGRSWVPELIMTLHTNEGIVIITKKRVCMDIVDYSILHSFNDKMISTLLAAVRVLHHAKILHGDISEKTVNVDETGEFYISNFSTVSEVKVTHGREFEPDILALGLLLHKCLLQESFKPSGVSSTSGASYQPRRELFPKYNKLLISLINEPRSIPNDF